MDTKTCRAVVGEALAPRGIFAAANKTPEAELTRRMIEFLREKNLLGEFIRWCRLPSGARRSRVESRDEQAARNITAERLKRLWNEPEPSPLTAGADDGL